MIKFMYMFLSIFLCGFSYFIWFFYGKDEKIIPVVNFYPPKNMLAAEVGTIYKNGATHIEIASLILQLAAKGYYRINNLNGRFILEKIKDYDGKNHLEKRMMDALFKRKNQKIASQTELEGSLIFCSECKKS